jgi:hypothetical protein
VESGAGVAPAGVALGAFASGAPDDERLESAATDDGTAALSVADVRPDPPEQAANAEMSAPVTMRCGSVMSLCRTD